MKRLRIITTLLASVVAFAALPVLPAAASAAATARLTNNAAVYPGSYTYTLSVTNNEPVGTLGTIGRGATINQIVVELPLSAGIVFSDGAPTAAGWTATKESVGRQEWVKLTGGSLAPGATLSINVPATAKAPLHCDTRGTWAVTVSSDKGESEREAAPASPGALDSKVMIVEIVGGSLKPIAPHDPATGRGVTDRSGTGGQLITYEYQVKNHSRSGKNVETRIESNQVLDVPAAGSNVAVPPSATRTVATQIQLGWAPTQRSTVFTAKAGITKASGSVCAAAPEVVDQPFTVQVPVDVAFTSVTPGRVRSGDNSSVTITATAVKTGGAQFDLRESELTFGSNSSKTSLVIFNAGSHTRSLEYFFNEIVGTEAPYAAQITVIGEDFNLAAVNLVRNVGDITIDITAPVIELGELVLPLDGDGDRQRAVKNNDTLTITGSVVALANANDLAPGCPVVQVVPDAGGSRNMSVTCSSGSSAERTFTATLSGAYSWDSTAKTFTVTAAHNDTAGNEGTKVAPGALIDLERPALGGYGAVDIKGVVIGPRRISVQIYDQLGMVRGGCDVASWRVDGTLQVQNVYLGDGSTRCSGDTGDDDKARRQLNDGVRVLELRPEFAKEPHDTPTVTYAYTANDRAVGRYPAKDGASWDALQKTIETINEVIPPIPNITLTERKTGPGGTYVQAYEDKDENAWYTKAAGADGIRLSWNFSTATSASGPITGYRVRVTDAAGETLNEVAATGQNPLSGRWEGTITVPLPQAEGTYIRHVYVVSPGGILSDPNVRAYVVDTTAPVLDTRTFNGTDTVIVKFSEKIVAGSNFSSDWVIRYEVQTDEGTDLAATRARTIEVVDNLTRRLTISLADPSSYRSTDYRLFDTTRARFEDRAGNLMNDSI